MKFSENFSCAPLNSEDDGDVTKYWQQPTQYPKNEKQPQIYHEITFHQFIMVIHSHCRIFPRRSIRGGRIAGFRGPIPSSRLQLEL
jgi:hypothetical protein